MRRKPSHYQTAIGVHLQPMFVTLTVLASTVTNCIGLDPILTAACIQRVVASGRPGLPVRDSAVRCA